MLCHLSYQLPRVVERFLDRDRVLSRRFREETVSDILMGGLMMGGGRRVIVEFPDEARTGADMEWNFVNEDTGRFFRLLIQAKRSSILTKDHTHCDFKDWKRHSYKELYHKTDSGSVRQATVLCNAARATSATYPLYAFYNAGLTCEFARTAGEWNVQGINLADGYAIERLVLTATTGKPPRGTKTDNRSVGKIAPHLWPLLTLFCPSRIRRVLPFAYSKSRSPEPLFLFTANGLGTPMPPTPDDVRDRIEAFRGRSDVVDLPAMPKVATSIPDDVRAILSGSEARSGGELNRWRITFLSSAEARAEEDEQ